MTELLLEWVVSAAVLILVVLLLRAALGKHIGAGMRYGLWAVVLVRLLMPVSFLAVTVPELPTWTPPEGMREESIYLLPVDSTPAEESDVRFAEDGRVEDPNSFGYARLEDGGRTVTRYAEKISPLELLGWIWAAGAVVMAAILIAANARFALRLRRVRRPLKEAGAPVPVYVAPALPSPCLSGLFRPAVYVTEEVAADPVMLRHVLAHELTHYGHQDHLWSVLRGAALAVHWWNPLVWLAAVCSRRDGELACDEGALKRLGDGERAAYGETLLALVTAKPKPADLLSFATTMTGEKRSLRERIRCVACQPKQLVSAVAVVAFLLTLTVLVTFGQAKRADASPAPIPPGRTPPAAAPGDAWQSAVITVDEDGVPRIRYAYDGGTEDLWGAPIPAPREWAGQSAGERRGAKTLLFSPDIWAKLVSPEEGWLVACFSRGVEGADTYVYRTSDGGMTWTEVTMPKTDYQIADVGFLSPDRLLVAQRLYMGAPVYLTKDGGESWELVNLPHASAEVASIHVSDGRVHMAVLQDGEPAWSMASEDLGDTWTFWDDAAMDQFLAGITAEDLGESDANAGELAALLREASLHRWSRFRQGTEAWVWCEAELTVPLAAGGNIYLSASYRDQMSLVIGWDTDAGPQYAYYSSEALHRLVCRLGEPYPTEILPFTPDLNHDGKPDQLRLRRDPLGSNDMFLQIIAETDAGRVTWEEDLSTAHAGWCGLFLIQLEGEDYLLRYSPWMGGGTCSYNYRLFYVDADSMPVVVQENSVEFDLIFNPDYAGQHQYDPWAINDFMEDVNALLAGSTLVLITDENLKGTFEREGRLYDSVWWLDDDRDEDLSLLENLMNYGNYIKEHPDYDWPPETLFYG